MGKVAGRSLGRNRKGGEHVNTCTYDVHVVEETLARATSEDGTEVVELKEISISRGDFFISNTHHWVLSHHLMDWDECCWDHLFSDPEAAIDAYVKEKSRTLRTWTPEEKTDIFIPIYTKIDETFEFNAMKAEIDRRRNG